MGRGRQAAAPAGAEPESVGLPGLRGGVAGVKWELLTAPLRAARLVLGAAAALKIALCSSAFLKTVSPQNLLKTPRVLPPAIAEPGPAVNERGVTQTHRRPAVQRPRAPPAPGAAGPRRPHRSAFPNTCFNGGRVKRSPGGGCEPQARTPATAW